METNGSIYFIKHKNVSPIKIGFSNNANPYLRIESYKTGSPYGIDVLGFFSVKNAAEVEKKLHKKYQNKRVNGEWFDITIDDVKNELLIYSGEDLFSEMNEFFSHKLIQLNLTQRMSEFSFDSKGLKYDYINELLVLFSNNSDIKFHYKDEYEKGCEDFNYITLRDFNKKILSIANNYGFKSKSVSKNGLRYYIFQKH
jgi:DNA modification methylase